MNGNLLVSEFRVWNVIMLLLLLNTLVKNGYQHRLNRNVLIQNLFMACVHLNTVQCCYNAVNFLTNILKRHPVARP